MDKLVFQIIIGVLIVLTAILAGIYFYQQRIIKHYKSLLNEFSELKKKNIGKKIENAEQLKVTGESQKQLDQLKDDYAKKVEPKVRELDNEFKQLEGQIHSSTIFLLPKKLNKLELSLASLNDEIQKIENALHRLDELHQTHKHEIDQIRQRYRHFHHLLDEKSFEYGDSVKQLNQQLEQLEKQYDEFTNLSNNGDYNKAEEILADLKRKNGEFEELTDSIPKLYKPLFAEFPTQFEELINGYKQLKEDNYNFTIDNIPEKVAHLQEQSEDNIKQINRLQLDNLEESNKAIAEQIDDLYDAMQKEIDARPQVEHLMEILGKFVAHASHQNSELTKELDRLSINYTLNNHEIETARSLNEQIISISKEYASDQADLDSHTAIYSQVLDRESKNENSLSQIEKEQAKINDEVSKLQSDQERAQQMLQKYAAQVRAVRRQVEQLNLPGLPQKYHDYFFGVSDEVKKLAEELKKYRVDMDEVTKQLIIVESDLETLNERTNDIRDSVMLTERLLQYANRFSDNAQINEAAIKAQKQFEKFEYTDSLETIATALEEVEPGSYKRIEDAYYNEKG